MPSLKADSEQIEICADLLENGSLVVFPTETVYGLGADATNGQSVAAIYAAKQRPEFNPLICHVADLDAAMAIGDFNTSALQLAKAFWPGPLTLVVPRHKDCPVVPLASAGLDTLAIRVPAHPIAQALLRAFGKPIVAPSANISGQLSPTNCQHVLKSFPDLPVLDGGTTQVGLESTIIGCLEAGVIWLRAGGLSRQDIEQVISDPLIEIEADSDSEPRLAPGRLARHYAPNARLELNCKTIPPENLLLAFGAIDFSHPSALINLSPSEDLQEAAANLFSALHQLDGLAQAGQTISVMPIPNSGLGEAINDRLTRAANS